VADIKADGRISATVVQKTLAMLGVDAEGLDEMDRRILSAIIENYGGGPVGINTIAVVVGEEPDTIEEVYEPFLIQSGFLKRTPRGREVTEKAYAYLDYPVKNSSPKKGGSGPQQQKDLFE
jgi:Holliday junction DNA helicase RuvB